VKKKKVALEKEEGFVVLIQDLSRIIEMEELKAG
jgi:hypothetical protein